MILDVDMMNVLEIVFVVISLKLIVSRWQPPLQESLQSILCIIIGTVVGHFINPTREGLILGVVASSITFYGRDFFRAFTDLKSDLMDADINIRHKR